MASETSAIIMEYTLLDQYKTLAGTNSAPPEVENALTVAEERRRAFKARLESGEISYPSPVALRAPVWPRELELSTVETDVNLEREFFETDCPPGAFDFQWCSSIPSDSPPDTHEKLQRAADGPIVYSTGWTRPLEWFRATAYMPGCSDKSSATFAIHRWDGEAGAWVERYRFDLTSIPRCRDYVLYITDYPYTYASIAHPNGWDSGLLMAVVANYQ